MIGALLALFTAASIQGQEPPDVIGAFPTLEACEIYRTRFIHDNREKLAAAQTIPFCMVPVFEV